jgi:chromate transporter
VSGWRGAAAALVAFLLPSVALMIAFGAFYGRLRSIGALASFLDGMGIATAGVIAAVAVEMRRGAVHRRREWALAIGAGSVLVFDVLNLLEVVAIAALLGALFLRPPRTEARDDREPFEPTSLRTVMLLPAIAIPAVPLALLLFFVFARIGVATFGGGYAMIPAIEHEVVRARGWLSDAEFGDAMVIGQITPGPVAIAATFIGYRVDGLAGALAATLGIFGPPFALAVLAGHSLKRFRANRTVQGALRGVAPAVVGVVAAAAVSLARSTVHGWVDAAIALGAVAMLVVFRKLSPLVPLALGGIVQWLVRK